MELIATRAARAVSTAEKAAGRGMVCECIGAQGYREGGARGGTEAVRVITIALRLTGEQHAKSLNGCHDGGVKKVEERLTGPLAFE